MCCKSIRHVQWEEGNQDRAWPMHHIGLGSKLIAMDEINQLYTLCSWVRFVSQIWQYQETVHIVSVVPANAQKQHFMFQ